MSVIIRIKATQTKIIIRILGLALRPSILTVTRFTSRGTSVPDPNVISWWGSGRRQRAEAETKQEQLTPA